METADFRLASPLFPFRVDFVPRYIFRAIEGVHIKKIVFTDFQCFITMKAHVNRLIHKGGQKLKLICKEYIDKITY